MSKKLALVGLMVGVSAALGCAATAEEQDEPTSSVASSFSPMGEYDLPMPVEPALPGVDRSLRGDFFRLIEDEERVRRWERGNCFRYYARLYDPVREQDQEIPITVCN